MASLPFHHLWANRGKKCPKHKGITDFTIYTSTIVYHMTTTDQTLPSVLSFIKLVLRPLV